MTMLVDSAEAKIFPQNIDAEKAVIGAILLDPESIFIALEHIRPDDFYKNSHKIILECLIELFEKNEPIDLVTLNHLLLKKNLLEKIGGTSYLSELLDTVPTSANISFHAKIISEKSILRSLINTLTGIITECYEDQEDAQALLDRAESRIFDISSNKDYKDITPIGDQIKDSIAAIEDMYENKGGLTGLPCGFKDLDGLTSGFHESELIILAARPSMGKTAFCTAMMEHVALVEKKAVLFFSLEMSKESLVQRMLCSLAKVSSNELRKGFLAEGGWSKIMDAANTLSNVNIYIDDTPGISVLEMKNKARKLKAQDKVDLVIIDYLQLMQSYKKVENRQQEISEISRSLKGLAREIKVPVISLSQLSRAVESRADHRPMLSDLRDSGSIEQDADLVLMLMREEYYNATEDNRNKAEIIVGKNRNGPTGTVPLVFLKEFMRFENAYEEF